TRNIPGNIEIQRVFPLDGAVDEFRRQRGVFPGQGMSGERPVHGQVAVGAVRLDLQERVQRQFPRAFHGETSAPSRSPGFSRPLFRNSPAGIAFLPAGCTCSTNTAPPPHCTANPSRPTCTTVPGSVPLPNSGALRQRQIFSTSPPIRV